MKQNKLIIILLLLFAGLMSLPFLLPGCGALALVAIVPLLCAQRLAELNGVKRFFLWYYLAFVLFNALTTWWVCKATVGGGIFAVLANSLFMSLIFTLFIASKKKFRGPVPYIFLAVCWIAWERFYLTYAQVSWPWLVLGNAFGRSTGLIQWYEYTGLLGGSLWIWATNLAIYGIMLSLSDGSFARWNAKARWASVLGLGLLVLGPVLCSRIIYNSYEEKSEAGQLEVLMAQSNFDPYQKLKSVPQSRQNAQVVDLFQEELKDRGGEYPQQTTLLMLPETFCSDIWKESPLSSPTFSTFKRELLDRYPNTNILFGASCHQMSLSKEKPHILARKLGKDGWYLSYNSAFISDGSGRVDYTDKSKLVVGAEATPYPKLFVPLDDALGGVMGRDIPQGHAKVLNAVEYASEGKEISRKIPLGVPICYESIYPEFCTQYVRQGAQLICVITNDGWWGDTPGYRQHFSYSRLRAIELRRDIARCANTGISAFIDQRGDVLEQTKWWEPDVLHSKVNLTTYQTFFVRYGDITGRICTLLFLMLLLTLLVKLITKK